MPYVAVLPESLAVIRGNDYQAVLEKIILPEKLDHLSCDPVGIEHVVHVVPHQGLNPGIIRVHPVAAAENPAKISCAQKVAIDKVVIEWFRRPVRPVWRQHVGVNKYRLAAPGSQLDSMLYSLHIHRRATPSDAFLAAEIKNLIAVAGNPEFFCDELCTRQRQRVVAAFFE